MGLQLKEDIIMELSHNLRRLKRISTKRYAVIYSKLKIAGRDMVIKQRINISHKLLGRVSFSNYKLMRKDIIDSLYDKYASPIIQKQLSYKGPANSKAAEGPDHQPVCVRRRNTTGNGCIPREPLYFAEPPHFTLPPDLQELMRQQIPIPATVTINGDNHWVSVDNADTSNLHTYSLRNSGSNAAMPESNRFENCQFTTQFTT